MEDVQFEACPACLFDLALQVATDGEEEGRGGGTEGEREEQCLFLSWLRVLHAEGLQALHDFALDISAEAGFAQGLGADDDRRLDFLAASAEGVVQRRLVLSARHFGQSTLVIFLGVIYAVSPGSVIDI